MRGTLYGVGLGPGDAELITLKAARLIQNATVIAYPQAEGVPSLARSIAQDFIPTGITEITISLPMKTDRSPAQNAYDLAAQKIRLELESGKDVICLCEGDPFFYGSFMYLFGRLKSDFAIEIVPGVTSVSACASVAQVPLVARNDALKVVAGPRLAKDRVFANRVLNDPEIDTIVIMKIGRYFDHIRDLIADANLLEHATYVERASSLAQQVYPLAEAPARAPYFSMILIVKEADPWL